MSLNNSVVQIKACFFRYLLSSFYCVAHRRKRHVKPFCQIRHLESQAQSHTNNRVSPWLGPCLFAFLLRLCNPFPDRTVKKPSQQPFQNYSPGFSVDISGKSTSAHNPLSPPCICSIPKKELFLRSNIEFCPISHTA